MNWMAEAACKEYDYTLFFPKAGQNSTHAQRICSTCPVQAECLRHAARLRLQQGALYGVWAGRTMDKLRLDQARRILQEAP